MRRALYAGSFDPIHRGHLDIITRGARLFDELIVAVGMNVKKSARFDFDTRLDWVKRTTASLSNVKVCSFTGLVVDLLQEHEAHALLRGIRGAADLAAEAPVAEMNRQLHKQCDTVFLLGDPQWGHVSSSLLKEVARFGGDISPFLAASIANDVTDALALK